MKWIKRMLYGLISLCIAAILWAGVDADRIYRSCLAKGGNAMYSDGCYKVTKEKL